MRIYHIFTNSFSRRDKDGTKIGLTEKSSEKKIPSRLNRDNRYIFTMIFIKLIAIRSA